MVAQTVFSFSEIPQRELKNSNDSAKKVLSTALLICHGNKYFVLFPIDFKKRSNSYGRFWFRSA